MVDTNTNSLSEGGEGVSVFFGIFPVPLDVDSLPTSLPEATRRELEWGMERTRDNTGLQLNLAVSYGGREEILDAARAEGKIRS